MKLTRTVSGALMVLLVRLLSVTKACSAFVPGAVTQPRSRWASHLGASTTPSSRAPRLTLEDGVHAAEQVIKKSRFIGFAKRCDNWGDAQEFVAAVKEEHPKARHWCFGWVAGHNPVQERASDDGEPTGTAGSPILGGIKGEDLSDCCCVVVRYSGGIKLGAGGLIRAYGGTARLALREAPQIVLVPKTAIRVSTSAANAGSVYQMATKFGGVVGDESYNETGDLEVTLVCETEHLDNLKQSLVDATRGSAKFLD